MFHVYKHILSLAFYAFFLSFSLQSQSFEQLLSEGKNEFAKGEIENYSKAISSLEQAVKLKPNNSEAWYFLGYSYSRLNYASSHEYLNAKSQLTIKASEAFEKVNQIEPKYSGQIIALDPYSKITAEWGVLALSFIEKAQIDSAIWSFKEGKKRGGFGEFLLAYNRNVLRNCSPTSMLFTVGDNFYFYQIYLQRVEGFRTDVSVINIDLLNTKWYPFFIQIQQGAFFQMNDSLLKDIVYQPWKDSMFVLYNNIRQQAFAWQIHPTYLDAYILRNDMLMLDLLKQNSMTKEVFFTNGIPNQQVLFLRNQMLSLLVVNKMNIHYEKELSEQEFINAFNEFSNYLGKINSNSIGELFFVDDIRIVIAGRIKDAILANNMEHAKFLLSILNNSLPEDKFPIYDQNLKKFIDNSNITIE